jgi:alpha-L-fucosidase 2
MKFFADFPTLVVTPRDILLKKLETEVKAAGDDVQVISIPQTYVYTSAELDTLSSPKSRMDGEGFAQRQYAIEQHWQAYCPRSAVKLKNPDPERIWYHNQYFLACYLK